MNSLVKAIVFTQRSVNHDLEQGSSIYKRECQRGGNIEHRAKKKKKSRTISDQCLVLSVGLVSY